MLREVCFHCVYSYRDLHQTCRAGSCIFRHTLHFFSFLSREYAIMTTRCNAAGLVREHSHFLWQIASSLSPVCKQSIGDSRQSICLQIVYRCGCFSDLHVRLAHLRTWRASADLLLECRAGATRLPRKARQTSGDSSLQGYLTYKKKRKRKEEKKKPRTLP